MTLATDNEDKKVKLSKLLSELNIFAFCKGNSFEIDDLDALKNKNTLMNSGLVSRMSLTSLRQLDIER